MVLRSSWASGILQLKWLVLLVSCLTTFGNYYTFDFPGSIGAGPNHTIQQRFVDHNKTYTHTDNQALYSVYSWPNTVLAIFGGLFIDNWPGLRVSLLVFVSLVFLGSVVFVIAVSDTSLALMLFGRFLFGLGGECVTVAQSAFTARWFKGKSLALAFAITVAASRVGSSFNFLISRAVATHRGVVTAVGMGSVACAISLSSSIILVMLDLRGTRLSYVPELTSLSSGGHLNLRRAFKLPLSFWLICGICFFIYVSIFPFIGIAVNEFQVLFGISGSTAGVYTALFQITAVVVSPMFGLLLDALGRFSQFLIASCCGFSVFHILVLVANRSDVWPAFLMPYLGVTYSLLVASLWPAVPYTVRDEVIGLAYGVMTAIQNLGLATYPILVGMILDHHTPHTASTTHTGNATNSSHHHSVASGVGALPSAKGYHLATVLLLFSAIAAVALAITLYIVDRRGTRTLTSSRAERRRLEQEEYQTLDVDPLCLSAESGS